MTLNLAYDLEFKDLYSRDELLRVDGAFVDFLKSLDIGIFNRLMTARKNGFESQFEESEFIIALAPLAEEFLAKLFNIEKQCADLKLRHSKLSPIYECKRQFVQRRVARGKKPEDAQAIDGEILRQKLEKYFGKKFDCLAFAQHVLAWCVDENKNAEKISVAEDYTAWALWNDAGRKYHKKDVLYKIPQKTNPTELIAVETELRDGYQVLKIPESHRRARDGFKLTDSGADLELALDQAHYCIFCHKQGKDSCAKGLLDKTGKTKFQKSAHGVELAGCPLDEKISEMNLLKSQGHAIGALAAAAIDNPLCAMTGHRICNDCMKSCIYQKQQPVDIPQIETRTLKDALDLPWGFEIYSLLTRWNPLNVVRPVPLAPTGRKILIAGAGPAGINLSHHLINDGHYVCLIDGLKIEPLDVPFAPIQNAADLWEDLDKRIMAGFGGVAEYGITVRWDKNFLKIVRLLLERRENFDLFGGVRFGGTITMDQAFTMGFDHVALCLGAGKPTILNIPGNLAKGVRAASDFLMALQLTGAGKSDSLANLQIRLPAIVIGGGLTAIDTATEILAYYPVQVEKFLMRFEQLGAVNWTQEDRIIADEFMTHARAIRAERKKKNPDIIGLLQQWGGVTICYRKDLQSAPSYTLNHEEVEKALEEGIFIAPNLTPREIKTDEYGWVESVVFQSSPPPQNCFAVLILPQGEGYNKNLNPPLSAKRVFDATRGSQNRDSDFGGGGSVTISTRSILVAAGTQPNTVLAREEAGLNLDGKYFQAYDETGTAVAPQKSAKPEDVHIFMHQRDDGRKISFFGDLHPSFAGNVVKAMASAKRGYPIVSKHLKNLAQIFGDVAGLRRELHNGLNAKVHEVNRLTHNIVEVVVHAPMAAENFQPGQFYRLQNFESGRALAMEGLAMTGAWVDRARGLLSTIVLEMGGSSSLCHLLKPGEDVVLMGPTGTPTEIPKNEKVVLIGGGLGNAVLFSIGQAMRKNGCHVTYFAGYKNPADRFKPDEIESASDIVVWCSDVAPAIAPGRNTDRNFIGNIVDAIAANADLLTGIERIICIGSDKMMAAVAHARNHGLKNILGGAKIAVASINSPMQCMMKEVCAQCIQRHIDPATGEEKIVFSCFNQDQDMDMVDWQCLSGRLSQNTAQERLTAKWIAELMQAQ